MANVGLFHPGTTIIHRITPFTKLVLAGMFSIAGFIAPGLTLPLILLVISIILLVFAKALREVFTTLFKFLLFFMIVLFVVQSLWWSGESAIWMLGPLKIHVAGFLYSCTIASRLLVVLCSFYALMFTTHPSDLILDLEQRGLPPRIGYVALATMQSIIEMQERAAVIMEVQQCRAIETRGSLKNRAKAYFPLVGPLIVGSVLNIESRALALEVRGFSSTQVKTHLKQIAEFPWENWVRYLLYLLPIATLAWRLLWR
jgi:energy-coupling factor transport system permease protein